MVLVVDTIADVTPGEGQVVVKTLACGICGSDLHAFHHAHEMVDASKRAGASFVMDPGRDIVLGHEFCGEILDHGSNTQKTLKQGIRVCSVPIAVSVEGEKARIHTLGYSDDLPGGFAEHIVLNEMLMLEVPNGLPTEQAALTEPMAVGWYVVERTCIMPEDIPLVIGCAL